MMMMMLLLTALAPPVRYIQLTLSFSLLTSVITVTDLVTDAVKGGTQQG